MGMLQRPAAVVAVVVVALAAVVLVLSSRGRRGGDAASAGIARALEKAVRGRPDRADASVLVVDERRGLHVLVRSNPSGPDAFHVASIGKVFTAVLVGKLVDAGRIGLDDRVAPLLPPGTLDGLFVVDGVDHQGEVTVAQLLAHTSGAADCFADPASGGSTVSRLIATEPDRAWTPADLLDFSRTQQSAVGAPGRAFHYSDTGYVVLGLLVERLYGVPFETALDREILAPLGMDRTWMPYRGSPRVGAAGPLRAAWLGGVEVSGFRSVTADWAGGGIASTEEDLAKFQAALWSGKLVSEATLASFRRFDAVFQKGIAYGKGLMELRFGEFFFLLRGYPKMAGHMGVLGTQMFTDPASGLQVVVNLGSDAAMEDSVRLIITVVGIVQRMR